MKQQKVLLVQSCLLGMLCTILIGGMSFAADQSADVALLIQRTPEEGGTVTPAVGVMRYTVDQQLQLTAVPKPGFQFVYWLGEVSDPQAMTTTTFVDKPKIIVAVFERVAYDAVGAGVGAGGRVSSPALIPAGGISIGSYSSSSSGGNSGGGSSGGGDPGEGDPDPDPDPEVPEPATCALLLAGSLLALRKRR